MMSKNRNVANTSELFLGDQIWRLGNEMFKHENSIKLQKEKGKVNKHVQTVDLVNIGYNFKFFFLQKKKMSIDLSCLKINMTCSGWPITS